jgi:hypothetical protein
MKKTIRYTILADPSLLWMYVILAAVIEGISIYYSIVIKDNLGVDIFLLMQEIGWLLILVWSSNQWFMRLSFRQNGILLLPGVRKSVLRPYKYYQYVYKARYFHGSPIGVGYMRYYMVFSHRRLTDIELNNINMIAGGTDIIKVKYSKKVYQSLMNILPHEMAYKLKICSFE